MKNKNCSFKKIKSLVKIIDTFIEVSLLCRSAYSVQQIFLFSSMLFSSIDPFNRGVDKSLQPNQRNLYPYTTFLVKLKSLDDLDFTTKLSNYFQLFMASSRSQFSAKIIIHVFSWTKC